MYKAVALLRQTAHLVLYRDTNEKLELWGMRQRKVLKRGELTLLNAMELSNLRILELRSSPDGAYFDFPETAGGSMCPEVGTWAPAPKPDPGAAFALQQHGRPSCPCWQPDADVELESSRSLTPCMRPLPVRWAVESASASGGRGLWEEAPPCHHCWPGQGWSRGRV